MSLVGSAAISGGASILGGLISGIGRRKREKRQHQRNLELADYQHSKDLDIWNKSWERETKYNDPKAQMDRLKNAGISPHMAYASGTPQNVAASGELPNYTQPEQQYDAPTAGEDMGQALGKGIGTMAQVLQIKLMKEQVRKVTYEADQEEVSKDRARAMWAAESPEYSDTMPDVSAPGQKTKDTLTQYHASEYGRQRAISRNQKELNRLQTSVQIELSQAQKAGKLTQNDIDKLRLGLENVKKGIWSDPSVKKAISVGVKGLGQLIDKLLKVTQ